MIYPFRKEKDEKNWVYRERFLAFPSGEGGICEANDG
jgi:hypothetical protein